jgi:DNA-binding NarL/FixJ family response regulator
MKIVSLEDDEGYWDLMEDALRKAYPRDLELIWIDCESKFYDLLPRLASSTPDIFLLDVMVKWAHAAEIMPPAPENVKRDGYYRAGIRCREKLRQDLPEAKAILFTVLDEHDVDEVTNGLPADTIYVRKDTSFEALLAAIKKLTSR